MQILYLIPVQKNQESFANLCLESIVKSHRKAGLPQPKITCLLCDDTRLKTRVQCETIDCTQSPFNALHDITLSQKTHVIFLSPDVILTNPPLWVLSGFDFCGFHNGGNLAPNNKAFAMTAELLQAVQNYLATQPLDALQSTLQFLPSLCTLASMLSARPKVFPPVAKDKMFIGAFCLGSFAADGVPLYIMDCGGQYIEQFAVAGLDIQICIANAMRTILRKS